MQVQAKQIALAKADQRDKQEQLKRLKIEAEQKAKVEKARQEALRKKQKEEAIRKEREL